MVWGGISWRHKMELQVVDGELSARRYIEEVLEPVVVPFLRGHNDVATLQQDNARPHSARVTSQFLQQNNVNVLRWPAFSPDLSPIEHLWDQLGRRVYNGRRQVRNRQELIDALRKEWDVIPQFRIQRLIRSMRWRCQSVMNARGGHSRY